MGVVVGRGFGRWLGVFRGFILCVVLVVVTARLGGAFGVIRVVVSGLVF